MLVIHMHILARERRVRGATRLSAPSNAMSKKNIFKMLLAELTVLSGRIDAHAEIGLSGKKGEFICFGGLT
jgi:hypothetical protein